MPRPTGLLAAALLLALLWLSVAASPPAARAQEGIDLGEGPVVLTADALRYDRATETVVAEGDVEISRGGRRLLADRVIYEVAEDRVEAVGGVTLIEPGGETVFADRAALTGDLREGFVQSVGVLFDDESRLAAARGRRVEGNRTILERAVYSPCPLCPEGDGPPLWRLRAARVTHDQEAQEVIYRDAVFELFGVPIAYTPYFRHPDPTVERKTGLLTPTFGSDSELGFFAETPVYFALAPNRDLTLVPVTFTQANPLLAAEYRERRRGGYVELGGSATYASKAEADSDGDEELRGHLEGLGRFRLSETWRAGYQLELTTDDTYLRRYDISNASILENRLFAERIWNRNYLGINGYGFQGLRRTDDQGEIPIVLPLAELSLISDPWRWGSHFELDANLLALTRTGGLDTRRLSVSGGWELPWIGPIGDLYELRLSLRGDLYQYDGDPVTKGDDGSHAEGRIFPTATLDWRWPLVREAWGFQQVLEPVVSASWSPSGLNDEDIPNEDSLDFEFDDTNLFFVDRFTGLDLVEEGARVSYGLRFSAFGPRGELLSGLIGQSYRFDDDEGTFPEGSGLDEELSDYVGRIDLSPRPWLDLTYRFRARKEDLRLLRSDLNARLGPPRLRFDVGYISLAKEQEEEGFEDEFDEREELTAGVFIGLTPELGVGARTRRDLTNGEPVTTSFGVIYRHPCLTVVGAVERDFTRDRDLEPTTTVAVRLVFRNLGEIEVDSGLFGLGSS